MRREFLKAALGCVGLGVTLPVVYKAKLPTGPTLLRFSQEILIAPPPEFRIELAHWYGDKLTEAAVVYAIHDFRRQTGKRADTIWLGEKGVEELLNMFPESTKRIAYTRDYQGYQTGVKFFGPAFEVDVKGSCELDRWIRVSTKVDSAKLFRAQNVATING